MDSNHERRLTELEWILKFDSDPDTRRAAAAEYLALTEGMWGNDRRRGPVKLRQPGRAEESD